MAKFPKAGILNKGENPRGFRSVGGDAYANRDPTHPGKKGDMWNRDDESGSRWGQLDRGQVDDQGAFHDW